MELLTAFVCGDLDGKMYEEQLEGFLKREIWTPQCAALTDLYKDSNKLLVNEIKKLTHFLVVTFDW